MPANCDLPPQYKIYTGRTFILRKHKTIPASLDKKAKTRKYYNTREVFGEACLVMDETNSRVKITTLIGRTLWISKFYLHKEIVANLFENYDYISKLAHELVNGKSENIKEAGKALRQYADILKPVNQKEKEK